VSKPELGTKRLCAGCNAKFYDLHKTPIVCPTCEAVFIVPKPVPSRSRRPFEPMIAPLPVAVAPKSAAIEDAPIAAEKVEGEADKEADAGVPLLEEMDED
jgi:uncharacterized protein (TIGR02300 family)